MITAFAAAPNPPPPNISILGGPHSLLLIGQEPRRSFTYSAFSRSSSSKPKNLSIPSDTDLPIPATLNFEEISIVFLKSSFCCLSGPKFNAQS